MKINDLIIEYLKEHGFQVSKWEKLERVLFNSPDHFQYYYIIIPGLHKLIIAENDQGGIIKLSGIPGFEISIDIRNPESLPILVEKLKKLYIWMEGINPPRKLTHESTRFNSGVAIRNS